MSIAPSNSSPLLTPINIGNLQLKNRLAVPAMVTVYCDTDGMATERFIAYHEARAKGGWGLIITEDYAVDPAGRGFWTSGLWKDEQIASHKELTERVHQHGCKIVAQIYHCGRQTSPDIIGCQPVSASAIPCPAMGSIPRALTIPEIKKIVCQFGDTAYRAKMAGFDGVEVHGAHGYLIAQFMSNYSNKRSDEYGGSLHNRMRFPLEIIADIRQKCGSGFPVIFRISADEFVPGGRNIEDTKAIAIMLQKAGNAGIDAIHVSAGVYGSTATIIPPLNVPHGWIVDFAEEVKKVVDIPVITVGRINDPHLAESVIISGKADIVAMGRGSLADPDLPNKFAGGKCEDICHCIGCQQGCLQVLFRNEPIRCLVNPTCGFEYLNEQRKADKPKRVVVVGGGPAGMEAAIAAARAGHKVSLYEKEDYLGGEFALAPVPPSKGDMSLLLAWEQRQLQKNGVDVHLGTEFTPEMADEIAADTIILATGAIPSLPSIPGIDHSHVLLAREVLWGRVAIGKEVVVLGGGLIGAETAAFCTEQGVNVSIVEQLSAIALEEDVTRRGFLLKLLDDKKVDIMTETQVVEIKEDCVVLETEGEVFEYPADTVIIAMGMESYNPLQQALAGKAAKIAVVGDAVEPRNALEATREGFLAGVNA